LCDVSDYWLNGENELKSWINFHGLGHREIAGEVIIFLLSYFIRESSVNERCSMDRGHSEGIQLSFW
jgi:hypothetical protein